ncbi:aromatic acid exporter family protein [Halobacillus yeomjeoni]|uniref:Aromatic acid exporter family protein n=1 Tax=Halobacillus yeomjeoni TaxID=311194 RepID=A0A931MVJ5_9BACI|nr:aromatic acid exporter family protein [Halobacillus yeomjeoni]MBH0231103.1 aromatic acid exporter family protein [Halobacillus yeomjeoni]MCA0984015.1 aromatic acid exporter family protein [Halobacillus yeomjeoni]
MKLGARMMKTGLAVGIALYVSNLFGFISPLLAAIAVVFSIQPTIYRSYQSIIEQIQGNTIGALIAIIGVYTLGNDPFIVGFAIIIVIGVTTGMKMNENTIALAVVAVIALMDSTDQTFMYFAFSRFTSMLLGIFAAFVVNLVFLPPRYETRLFNKIDLASTDILQWLRVTTRQLSDEPALKYEITRIQDDVRWIDHTYLLYSEERTYFKGQAFAKGRKLVLFRQLITTTKKSFDVLKTFHRLDDKIEQIPEEFQDAVVNELDKLISAHEKLILSLKGRIKNVHKQSLRRIEDPDIPKLVERLIHVYEESNNPDKLVFLPLASQLMEYHDQLEKLKRLLKSYQTHHKEAYIQTTQK